MVAVLALALVVAASPERPKLAVMDLSAGVGVDAAMLAPLTEAVTGEIQRRGFFDVLSQRDIATMVGVERQKQLLGCSDERASCLAELSGALGARFVMSGTLARLGDAYQLTLNTLDTQKAQPLGRATRLARDLGALQQTIPWAVAEATATPLPQPPSRVLPFTLLGAGAAAVVAGFVIGALALDAHGRLTNELDSGMPGTLRDRAYYESSFSGVERNEGIAIAALAGGAVLFVLGLLFLPSTAGSF